MKLKFFGLVILVGLIAVFGAAAQSSSDSMYTYGDPDPSLYFDESPDKLGERFVIFYAGNVADFTDLPETLAAWNKKTMENVVKFIASNSLYNIKVRGGTNGDLKGLDSKRVAEAIVLLHFFGVPGDRIVGTRSTESLDWVATVGGSNGWMNRRVDFELVLREY